MVLSRILRAGEGKTLRRLSAIAAAVNDLEDEIKRLSDAELRAETDVFKKRLADGEEVDDILVESFAVAREAAWRTLGQRPFDVQVMRSSVVLPAPFGPSRPNTPGPACRLTPATAWLRPNRLVRSMISTFITGFLSGSASRRGRPRRSPRRSPGRAGTARCR